MYVLLQFYSRKVAHDILLARILLKWPEKSKQRQQQQQQQKLKLTKSVTSLQFRQSLITFKLFSLMSFAFLIWISLEVKLYKAFQELLFKNNL